MQTFDIRESLQQKILPAVSIDNSEDALPVAEALLKGGLPVMEIQFRTGVAAASIEMIRKNFPEMVVGAGTILTIEQLRHAIDAGAQFGLSPSFSQVICDAVIAKNFPFIPGVMTPSEVETANEMGFDILKLFPAAQLGGAAFLKALLGPYEQLKVQFIPMGGVNPKNMTDYLKLRNVIALGGSWLASKELISTKNFAAIYNNAVEALKIVEKSSYE